MPTRLDGTEVSSGVYQACIIACFNLGIEPFDYEEVIAWAKRWSQDAEDQGIHAKIDPGEQRRSLQQALASLPV